MGQVMYCPSKPEFIEAANHGNLLAVYREIVADAQTPVSTYAAFAHQPYAFLLESVVGGSTWAAYSFIGVAPRAVITWDAGQAQLRWLDGAHAANRQWAAADPTAALAEVLGELRPVATPGLPRFWGGAVGWLGYDAVRAMEVLPSVAAAGPAVPTMCMVLTDTLIIFDNMRQTVKLVATCLVRPGQALEALYDAATARIDELAAALTAHAPRLRPLELDTSRAAVALPSSSMSRADFEGAVHRIQAYIKAGDAFQVVLSQRFAEPAGAVDPFDAYRALRITNPSPYMYHLNFPEAVVTGASPETLVRLEGKRMLVRPIAGTRPRGATPTDDERLATELRVDAKECAEHLMLIDLGRNDVGRVARAGTVRASDVMAIERYSHVMHMTSTVEGELAADKTWRDVLRAAFPAGTLTGAPKVRAMEIIESLEPVRRGLYGGALGYVGYDGNMDFAIAIRTMVLAANTVYVQAGAGIVHDSEPHAEYQETLNKAASMLRAIAMARHAAASVKLP